jgi:hypothetical protein
VSVLGFYAQIVRTLDEMGVPYMMVGAFAGLSFGVTRTTFDIDMLVDLREEHVQPLVARFPAPRYYADAEMMRESVLRGTMFNIIDSEEGVKADLVPVGRESGYKAAFGRGVRRRFEDLDGTEFEAWCARPEDVILGKLAAWAEGESAKHPADIFDMLIFAGSGAADFEFDPEIVTLQAATMGQPVLDLWLALQKRAQEELDSRT